MIEMIRRWWKIILYIIDVQFKNISDQICLKKIKFYIFKYFL